MDQIFRLGNRPLSEIHAAFFMKASNITPHVRVLVDLGGGVLVTQPTLGALEIIPSSLPGSKAIVRPEGDKGYSFSFIEDSVQAGKMMRLENYEVRRTAEPTDFISMSYGKRLREKGVFEVDLEDEQLPTKRPKIAYKAPGLPTIAENPMSVPIETPKLIESSPRPRKVFFSGPDEHKMKNYAENIPGDKLTTTYWQQALFSGLPVYHTAESLKIHWMDINKQMTNKPSPSIHSQKPASLPKKPQTYMISPDEVIEVHEDLPTPTRSPQKPTRKKHSLASPSETSRPKSQPQASSNKTSKLARVRLSPAKPPSPPLRCFKETVLSASPSSTNHLSPSKDLSTLTTSPSKLSQRFQAAMDFKISSGSDGSRKVTNMMNLRFKCLQASIPQRFLSLVERCQANAGCRLTEIEVLSVLLRYGGRELETEDYYKRRANPQSVESLLDS